MWYPTKRQWWVIWATTLLLLCVVLFSGILSHFALLLAIPGVLLLSELAAHLSEPEPPVGHTLWKQIKLDLGIVAGNCFMLALIALPIWSIWHHHWIVVVFKYLAAPVLDRR